MPLDGLVASKALMKTLGLGTATLVADDDAVVGTARLVAVDDAVVGTGTLAAAAVDDAVVGTARLADADDAMVVGTARLADADDAAVGTGTLADADDAAVGSTKNAPTLPFGRRFLAVVPAVVPKAFLSLFDGPIATHERSDGERMRAAFADFERPCGRSSN
jgi:hypothetical protein